MVSMIKIHYKYLKNKINKSAYNLKIVFLKDSTIGFADRDTPPVHRMKDHG